MPTNERLRSALLATSMTPLDLSRHLQVDPKTVERWIAGDRMPHRTNRLKAAALLGQSDTYLWPETRADRRTTTASQAELVELYPDRASIPRDLWVSLMRGATEQIDILAFAASFLHDTIPEFNQLITERAAAGVKVRLLFGDPDGEAVARRGAEEGIGDLLAARCRLTWAYCAPLLEVEGVEMRRHDTTLYNSIFRFDDDMLVNTHLYGAAASHSPVLHLHRVAGGTVVAQYAEVLDAVWHASD